MNPIDFVHNLTLELVKQGRWVDDAIREALRCSDAIDSHFSSDEPEPPSPVAPAQPLYYVNHPDGSFSAAEPQPFLLG